MEALKSIFGPREGEKKGDNENDLGYVLGWGHVHALVCVHLRLRARTHAHTFTNTHAHTHYKLIVRN